MKGTVFSKISYHNFILRNTNLTIIFLRILRLFHFLLLALLLVSQMSLQLSFLLSVFLCFWSLLRFYSLSEGFYRCSFIHIHSLWEQLSFLNLMIRIFYHFQRFADIISLNIVSPPILLIYLFWNSEEAYVRFSHPILYVCLICV